MEINTTTHNSSLFMNFSEKDVILIAGLCNIGASVYHLKVTLCKGLVAQKAHQIFIQ